MASATANDGADHADGNEPDADDEHALRAPPMTSVHEPLPGNLRVRLRRLRAETFAPDGVRRRSMDLLRPWMVPASFAFSIAVGTVLLALPWAASDGGSTTVVDAMFTATSAVCVTGLVRFDTAEHFTLFGEIVVAALIQLGGLGVTMYAGLFVLLAGRRLGIRGREFIGVELIGDAETDVTMLLRRVMKYTVAIELATFLLIAPWFALREDNLPTALWHAAFTSVSEFNNAGFDLMGGSRSLSDVSHESYPLAVLGLSALLGALSFVTVFNLSASRRRWTLDTRLTVTAMSAVLFGGALLVFLVERDGVLTGLSLPLAIENAWFLVANRSAGMTTVDMTAVNETTAFALMVMMFIGGASTSTAGGIKVGALMVAVIAVLSGLRGRPAATVFGREIPQTVVLRALTIIGLGIATHALGSWLLAYLEGGEFVPMLFESMSALANTGWTQDVTATLSTPGALLVTLLMFVGRLGPLAIVFSIPDRAKQRYRLPAGTLRIG
jgi:trk system potassium uptake protein TrkH